MTYFVHYPFTNFAFSASGYKIFKDEEILWENVTAKQYFIDLKLSNRSNLYKVILRNHRVHVGLKDSFLYDFHRILDRDVKNANDRCVFERSKNASFANI